MKNSRPIKFKKKERKKRTGASIPYESRSKDSKQSTNPSNSNPVY